MWIDIRSGFPQYAVENVEIRGKVSSTVKNLIGERFGRLVVIENARQWSGSQLRWFCVCRCDCGREKVICKSDLVRSEHPVRSCGCLMNKHGLRKTLAYRSWVSAKNRCYSKKNPAYSDYGGRGIRMCKRWRRSVEAFIQDMGERPEGLTLERVNNDGNYEPGNCKWATYTEQANNRRQRKKAA